MMSSFTTPLRYENINGRDLTLTEEFTYRVGSEDSSEFIRVPKGFTCDAQSYPRFLWFIDHPQGKGAKAGFLHDYLYWMNGRPIPETNKQYNRKQSDQIFLEALEVCGVNVVSRRTRYRVLRLLGRFAWKKHTRRIKREEALNIGI